MKLNLSIVMAMVLLGCTSRVDQSADYTSEEPLKTVNQKSFGMVGEEEVYLFTLKNASGMVMQVTNYGAIITSLRTPDRNGNYADIVLGYDNLQDYLDRGAFFGSIVGRYGNRIGRAKFTLDGEEYILAKNNGPNSLHGGLKGFDKVIWSAEPIESDAGPSLRLSYLSPHMEEGFPGNLTTGVIYTLTNNNELLIEYRATTDRPTIVNLTNHTYFNFSGADRDILDHEVELMAQRFIPVDSTLIPLGELQEVAGTPFDFNQPVGIGERINEPHEQLIVGRGYDHCWVLDKGLELGKGGSVYDPVSGRYMQFLTSEPGVQLYTGNFLDGSITGKNGKKYERRWALCLETQHYPDSPNQPDFPTTTLNPGEEYRSTTIYRFSTKE